MQLEENRLHCVAERRIDAPGPNGPRRFAYRLWHDCEAAMFTIEALAYGAMHPALGHVCMSRRFPDRIDGLRLLERLADGDDPVHPHHVDDVVGDAVWLETRVGDLLMRDSLAHNLAGVKT